MAIYSNFLQKIEEYIRKYRRVDLESITINKLYDLFPEQGASDSNVAHNWPEEWPNLDSAGVYAFLSKNLEVLYIGKASMNHGLGWRLSAHCSGGKNKPCKLTDKWKGEPRYVAIIAVPDSSKFEAPALEEFLVINCPTANNKVGNPDSFPLRSK